MINKVQILERLILDLDPEQRARLLDYLKMIHEIDNTGKKVLI